MTLIPVSVAYFHGYDQKNIKSAKWYLQLKRKITLRGLKHTYNLGHFILVSVTLFQRFK